MKLKLPLLLLLAHFATAQNEIPAFLDQNFTHYSELSAKIWQYAEPGYLEDKTSTALMTELSDGGFTIKKGVGGELLFKIW